MNIQEEWQYANIWFIDNILELWKCDYTTGQHVDTIQETRQLGYDMDTSTCLSPGVC